MTIALYITRLLAARVLASLLIVTALLQLFDLLNNARHLLSRGGGVSDLFTYAAMRLPMTIEQAIPIAMLVGALVTLFGLARSNETVALRSVGVTIYRILAICTPTAVVVGVVHFVLVDSVAPGAERRFVNWWTSFEAATADADPDNAIWLRTSDSIMRVRGLADGGRTLTGIRIVQLSENGLVSGWTDAEAAELTAEGWMLARSRISRITNGAVTAEQRDRVRWPSALDPASIVEVASPTESRSIIQLRRILQGTWAGDNSPAHYRTRLHRSYTIPLASVLMLLLAAPAAYMVRRRGAASRGLLWGFLLGMGYLITDGLLAALGSAGALPAFLAAWTAPMLFALIGVSVVLYHEE